MRCGDAEHLLQGDQRCEDDCNDHQEDENAVDASTTGHLPFAFATRWIDSPNRADLLMMVVIGRSNFSATVCSGVFALDRAISSRSCCIDHMRRLVLLAMIFPARIQQRQRREGKPESSGPRKLRGWNLRKAIPKGLHLRETRRGWRLAMAGMTAKPYQQHTRAVGVTQITSPMNYLAYPRSHRRGSGP
jgi:hypothetical protein